MYGGSTTSISVTVPGEAASVVTTIDGYRLARKGRAGAALAVAAIASFVAGTFSVVALQLATPLVARAALAFGPAEYFAFALLGVALLANLTGGSRSKSLATVGLVGYLGGRKEGVEVPPRAGDRRDRGRGRARGR